MILNYNSKFVLYLIINILIFYNHLIGFRRKSLSLR
ncbi:hypothetical protein SAMN05443429_10516 [Cruoricaptor ignavus]|uniref:Uncharacterized protein n=1 Tax=Cruoricaptor ignavus TaxID=1118202 RepID=A0A1M6E7Z3_9FLAO|nr:hypothetical protein SAMN05443429_10516 [Cruoricaptor ignavus]